MGSFRRGTLIGFGIGYVMGSKAGIERYHQIMRAWGKVKQTSLYKVAASQVEEAVGQGLERGKLVALDGMHKLTGQMIKEKKKSYQATPRHNGDYGF